MTSASRLSAMSTPHAIMLLATLVSSCTASPISYLNKRALTTGSKAGMAIGIAVAVIVVMIIVLFIVVHIRRTRHIERVDRERAYDGSEKSVDDLEKPEKFNQRPAPPTRKISIKDRFMAPVYRSSTIDLMPMPKAHFTSQNPNRSSTATMGSVRSMGSTAGSLFSKPWASNSPRPSFSSKRATRMMMMM